MNGIWTKLLRNKTLGGNLAGSFLKHFRTCRSLEENTLKTLVTTYKNHIPSISQLSTRKLGCDKFNPKLSLPRSAPFRDIHPSYQLRDFRSKVVYQDKKSQQNGPEFLSSHDQRSIGFIALAIISILTFTSLIYERFGCRCNKADDKTVKSPKCNLCSIKSIVEDITSSPSVHAAKPISDDSIIEEEVNIKDRQTANLSRRNQFNFIADVLEVVENAVVCIEVKDHSTVNWFGMPQASSNGSGFIVKEDGLILTNAHVVASQQRCSIIVKLKDGRCFPGFVEDVDYESDLATVRVRANGLPTLKMGCSSETRVGEWVVAVGSPLNLSNTVTAGIVSTTRKAHEIGIHQNDINYIQTDAAITFGNSGGPLINLDCEVIGINSMKVTPGISFAIPIDHAKLFLEKAANRRASGTMYGKKRYMGLTLLSLTDQIRRELEARTGYSVVNQGVFVWQVVRGGPAHLGGIQPGDVMISINGRPILSASQVHEIVKTEDRLLIEVQRGSNFYTFTVVPENVNEYQ